MAIYKGKKADIKIEEEQKRLNELLSDKGFTVDIYQTDDWLKNLPMYEAQILDEDGDEYEDCITGRYCDLDDVVGEIEGFIDEYDLGKEDEALGAVENDKEPAMLIREGFKLPDSEIEKIKPGSTVEMRNAYQSFFYEVLEVPLNKVNDRFKVVGEEGVRYYRAEDFYSVSNSLNSDVAAPVPELVKANDVSSSYEAIEIRAKWLDSGEEFTDDAAIGQWDGEMEDDHIFYWFDDYDKVFGEEHPDFVVLSYTKADSDLVITSDISAEVAAMSDEERESAIESLADDSALKTTLN